MVFTLMSTVLLWYDKEFSLNAGPHDPVWTLES